ncbi:MAG: hypothetical protein IJ481_01635 [Alphaproteobacteria bacterium]|nr:hypothetical protein [Alphaproteobacteria bacterium]
MNNTKKLTVFLYLSQAFIQTYAAQQELIDFTTIQPNTFANFNSIIRQDTSIEAQRTTKSKDALTGIVTPEHVTARIIPQDQFKPIKEETPSIKFIKLSKNILVENAPTKVTSIEIFKAGNSNESFLTHIARHFVLGPINDTVIKELRYTSLQASDESFIDKNEYKTILNTTMYYELIKDNIKTNRNVLTTYFNFLKYKQKQPADNQALCDVVFLLAFGTDFKPDTPIDFGDKSRHKLTFKNALIPCYKEDKKWHELKFSLIFDIYKQSDTLVPVTVYPLLDKTGTEECEKCPTYIYSHPLLFANSSQSITIDHIKELLPQFKLTQLNFINLFQDILTYYYYAQINCAKTQKMTMQHPFSQIKTEYWEINTIPTKQLDLALNKLSSFDFSITFNGKKTIPGSEILPITYLLYKSKLTRDYENMPHKSIIKVITDFTHTKYDKNAEYNTNKVGFLTKLECYYLVLYYNDALTKKLKEYDAKKCKVTQTMFNKCFISNKNHIAYKLLISLEFLSNNDLLKDYTIQDIIDGKPFTERKFQKGTKKVEATLENVSLSIKLVQNRFTKVKGKKAKDILNSPILFNKVFNNQTIEQIKQTFWEDFLRVYDHMLRFVILPIVYETEQSNPEAPRRTYYDFWKEHETEYLKTIGLEENTINHNIDFFWKKHISQEFPTK